MWSKLRKLHRQRHDIILLQETKLKDDDANDDLKYRWRQISNGEAYTSPACSAQSGGVAILLSTYACTLLTDRDTIQIPNVDHRHIILQAKLANQQVYIHSIYAPVHRSERPSFFANLTTPNPPGSHLVGGDFNCVIDTGLDSAGNHILATAGTIELTEWLANINAVDVWRVHNDDKIEYTSPGGTARIDMIFASGCFKNHTRASHAPRSIGSDHLCPSMTAASCEITEKNGHWQLPTWIARAASHNIKPILERLASETDHPDYFQKFTRSLKSITGTCQATHKRVLRSRREKLDRAKLRWIRAHTRATQTPTDELINDAENARQIWLKEIEKRGRQNRARAFDKHFSDAERCSTFFLRRPKPTRATVILGVRLNDGTTSTNPAEITSTHTSFWTELYSSNAAGKEQAPTQQNITNLIQTPLPKLPTVLSNKLEQDITEDDIIKHINLLPNNKAAGSDGLRAELLKCNPKLWARTLKPIFGKLLHQNKKLPQPLRESIIILLYKKGNTLDPRNYRPIALLSVIAKLLSGIHNSRIKHILTHIVPPEQTGFIPKRSITENITLLHDALYFTKRHHPSAIILSLDFQKAYDRVQQPVLLAILKQLGFGPRWLSFVSTMYSDHTARLNINGDLSPSFAIERGVLQGDPLSPALFILQCMPLYIQLNRARQQHGIPLPHGPPAPVATFYADDTTLLAKSPNNAVGLYRIAEWFCTHSGARLHPDKCVAIAAGPAPPTLPNGIKILEPSQHTTLLGIPIGTHTTRQQQTTKVILKLIQRCNNWAQVGRTIEGRITIVRAMLLSTIWYVLGALPTDNTEANKIQRVMNNFLHGATSSEWNGPAKRGHMTNAWFYRQKRLGGWGLTTITDTLRMRKLSMIRNLLNDEARNVTKPWHAFIVHMLEEHMQGWCSSWKDITLWNIGDNHSQSGTGNWNALTPWWRQAWTEWLKLDCRPQKKSIPRATLMRWPVWQNRILKTNHGLSTTLHYNYSNTNTRTTMSDIRKLGFIKFEDFMNNNGVMMNQEQFYTTVTVHNSVHNPDIAIPQWACTTLIRHVTALWSNASRHWIRPVCNTSRTNATQWWHASDSKTHFTAARNKTIAKWINSTRITPPPPTTPNQG